VLAGRRNFLKWTWRFNCSKVRKIMINSGRMD
jgi:hypothetical protein